MFRAKLHESEGGYIGILAWMFRNMDIPGQFVRDQRGFVIFDSEGGALVEAKDRKMNNRFSYACRSRN